MARQHDTKGPPGLGTLLISAISFAVGVAGFAITLTQVGSLGIRIAACAFVALVVVLVVVWYWGYQSGRRA